MVGNPTGPLRVLVVVLDLVATDGGVKSAPTGPVLILIDDTPGKLGIGTGGITCGPGNARVTGGSTGSVAGKEARPFAKFLAAAATAPPTGKFGKVACGNLGIDIGGIL